ncbi:hypothetical protein JST97_00145 [bacterium]|nr:hypothetical protein [bacterium]
MKIASSPRNTPPHRSGHSHNDEMQARPLAQALQDGFTSIEVDVHLINGRLLVGHSQKDAERKNLTLEAAYLAPLEQRVAQFGSVYPGHKEITLMLDFKGGAETTYKALKPLLSKYQGMLVQVRGGQEQPAPVKVVITGNQPELESVSDRSLFLDGSLRQALDHPGSLDPTVTPTVQGNYHAFFRWNGQGGMSAGERKKLNNMVAAVHAQGLQMRLWDAPDQPNAWQTFLEAGVDRINTDHLESYADWQSVHRASNTPPQPPVRLEEQERHTLGGRKC